MADSSLTELPAELRRHLATARSVVAFTGACHFDLAIGADPVEASSLGL